MTDHVLTCPHSDTADVFLTKEISDLHQRPTLLHDNVDGEMGIHRTHFVTEPLKWDKMIETWGTAVKGAMKWNLVDDRWGVRLSQNRTNCRDRLGPNSYYNRLG